MNSEWPVKKGIAVFLLALLFIACSLYAEEVPQKKIETNETKETSVYSKSVAASEKERLKAYIKERKLKAAVEQEKLGLRKVRYFKTVS